MSLIEYLLSCMDEQGIPIVYQTAQRIGLSMIVPGATIETLIRVNDLSRAYIVYNVAIDNGLTHNVMALNFSMRGNELYNDMVGNTVISNGIACFNVIDRSNPARFTVSNTSVIFQDFEAVVSYLKIQNDKDFDTVMEQLRNIHGLHNGVVSPNGGTN